MHFVEKRMGGPVHGTLAPAEHTKLQSHDKTCCRSQLPMCSQDQPKLCAQPAVALTISFCTDLPLSNQAPCGLKGRGTFGSSAAPRRLNTVTCDPAPTATSSTERPMVQAQCTQVTGSSGPSLATDTQRPRPARNIQTYAQVPVCSNRACRGRHYMPWCANSLPVCLLNGNVAYDKVPVKPRTEHACSEGL